MAKEVKDTAKADGKKKAEALAKAVGSIEKEFGAGSIMRLGEKPKVSADVIHTGSLNLDLALGIGGLPRGRIIEIYGPESSGKTTLALHCVAECQKAGGVAAYIDAEHAIDPVYAKNLGVDTDNLLISQPDSGEQALNIADALVRSGAIDIMVVDSVAALTPQGEIDGDIGDSHMGLQARLMSQGLRILSASIAKANTTVIFINQLRAQISTGYGAGPTETTAGGRALKYYASVRIDIRRIGSIKEKEVMIGSHTRCKVVKNKVAPPFATADFDIYFGKGISKMGEILDNAILCGVIEKSGSWFSFAGERLCQGKENVRRMMEENSDFADRVEEAVRAQITGNGVPTDFIPEEDEDGEDEFVFGED